MVVPLTIVTSQRTTSAAFTANVGQVEFAQEATLTVPTIIKNFILNVNILRSQATGCIALVVAAPASVFDEMKALSPTEGNLMTVFNKYSKFIWAQQQMLFSCSDAAKVPSQKCNFCIQTAGSRKLDTGDCVGVILYMTDYDNSTATAVLDWLYRYQYIQLQNAPL